MLQTRISSNAILSQGNLCHRRLIGLCLRSCTSIASTTSSCSEVRTAPAPAPAPARTRTSTRYSDWTVSSISMGAAEHQTPPSRHSFYTRIHKGFTSTSYSNSALDSRFVNYHNHCRSFGTKGGDDDEDENGTVKAKATESNTGNNNKNKRRSIDDIIDNDEESYDPRTESMMEDTDRRVLSDVTSFPAPEDPFGLSFQDGSDRLGPILPPIYERDGITGRFLSETKASTGSTLDISSSSNNTTLKQKQELSEQDRHLLSMDSMERDMRLLQHLRQHWQQLAQNDQSDTSSTTTGSSNADNTTTTAGIPPELNAMGERIRTTNMATNVLGRSVHGQRTKEILEDGTEIISQDEATHFSQPLTVEEYKTLELYMQQKYPDLNLSVDDIPVSTLQKQNPLPQPPKLTKLQRRKNKNPEPSPVHPDEAELSLKWLTSRAQRQMDNGLDDNPYADVMPGDLNPRRVVNRKQAKIIPTPLLHYNHMALLQHFIGPTGQILHRTQTRLGARDQRRVSRLIQRARALGLLPIVGQFKIENHGWIHQRDIHTDRPWERELKQRGLVVPPPSSLPPSATSASWPFDKRVPRTIDMSVDADTTPAKIGLGNGLDDRDLDEAYEYEP
jgi:ribosomal protein S18